MGLKEDIQVYREKATGIVGLNPNPMDRSEDNGLLFSATYLNLLGEDDEEERWFFQLVLECSLKSGLICRYPGDTRLQAHDDMIGVANFSSVLADMILTYGERNLYSWNTENPGKWTLRTFFYRMGAFVPFLKAKSDRKLNLLDTLNVFLSYYLNTREPKEGSSGKCLLYLMSDALENNGNFVTKRVVAYWRKKMMQMYPGGRQELYSIYFKPHHPFAIYAPKDFS